MAWNARASSSRVRLDVMGDAIRKGAMWLLGSTYDFRLSVATVMYEFRKDVVTCLLIGGALWLIDNRREARPPQPGAPEPPGIAPHTVWLRDGTTRIRIQPSDIVWVSSAGNYVEYSLANGSNHLVRGTLALIPQGSGDDFAKVLGIPRDVRAACELALRGNAREVRIPAILLS